MSRFTWRLELEDNFEVWWDQEEDCLAINGTARLDYDMWTELVEAVEGLFEKDEDEEDEEEDPHSPDDDVY